MTNPSPLRYPGGKYKTYEYIKNLVLTNVSTTYIEPFAGGAAVAFKLVMDGVVKKIIINDFDRSIYALWYSVLNHTNELIELIENTPIDMETWYKQKQIQDNKENESLLSLGFSTLFLNRTNRSGIIKAGVIGGKNQSGTYKLDCRFTKPVIIKKIKEISKLKRQISIYNMDAVLFIKTVIKKTRNSFTFFDPPYYLKGPGLYTNFYKQQDHLMLAKTIQTNMKYRKWIVTYDACIEIKEMYNKLFYQTFFLNYSAQNKRQGIEYMFFSNNTMVPNNHEHYLKLSN